MDYLLGFLHKLLTIRNLEDLEHFLAEINVSRLMYQVIGVD